MINLLFAALLFAQQAPTTYNDAGLHFTLAYPAYLRPSEEVRPPIPASQRAASGTASVLDCASIPFAAQREGSDTDFDMLLMSRLDGDCGKFPVTSAQLRQMATEHATSPLTAMARQTVSAPVAYSLNGGEAYFVQSSAQDDGITAWSSATCTLLQGNAICWTAFSSTQAHVPALLASTITFTGQPPQPLVPAALLIAQPSR